LDRPGGLHHEQARFVPCGADHAERLHDAWERYIHADAPDRLVQWRSFMPSSKRSTRSSTATGGWGG
jgi:hypothetical protein